MIAYLIGKKLNQSCHTIIAVFNLLWFGMQLPSDYSMEYAMRYGTYATRRDVTLLRSMLWCGARGLAETIYSSLPSSMDSDRIISVRMIMPTADGWMDPLGFFCGWM